MIIKDFSRYGNDISGLVKLSKISNDELEEALKNPYISYYQKGRLIEEPNVIIKTYSAILGKLFRQITCPPYNYAGYEGKNAYLNAKAHLGQFAYLTSDMTSYYLDSSSEHVLSFLTNELHIKKDDELEFLMKILTYNGHIPAGAPASPILAFLSHKKLFDRIYERMQALNILFTLYVDDITLSAKNGITNDVLYLVKDILAEHGLTLNPKKTKRYSYKKALITGFYLHQSGKITVPDKVGHSVIKKLQEKSITKMSLTELRKLSGKIGYIQYCDKNAFKITKIKANRQIAKLMKEQAKQRKETNNE